MANSINTGKLQTLQKTLNEAIDKLVELTDQQSNGTLAHENEQIALELFKTRETIGATAKAIGTETADPALTIHTLGTAPIENLVVRLGIDLDIFKIISTSGPAGCSLDEAVHRTGADSTFLLRILRALSSFGYLFEDTDLATKRFTLSPLGDALINPAVRDWVKVFYDDILVSMTRFPEFLAKRSYESSGTADDNLYRDMYGSNYFQYLHADAERQATFNSAMKIQDVIPKFVMASFPFDEYYEELREAKKQDSSLVSIVDVGGGHGQVLEGIRHDYPDLPGRFILQDLPQVVAEADEAGNLKRLDIETMAQDFLTPQKIKGAKFYHIRRCVHNWPEEACEKILINLYDAMKDTPNFSRLLLHENILPNKNIFSREAAIDMVMMFTLCGMERSADQWKELLRRTGFEIIKIHPAKVGDVGVMEAKVTLDDK